MLDNWKRKFARTSFWQRLGSRSVRRFWRDLAGECAECDSLLDLGCGSDPQSLHLNTAAKLVFGEACVSNLRQAAESGIPSVGMDVMHLPFKEKSVDGILLLQVLEHLGKQEGKSLLARMNETAKKIVVISTPNGFVEQGAIDGNIYQVHKCGWTLAELRGLGYRVWGYEGLRILRRPNTSEFRHPKAIWALFTRLGCAEWLCRKFPSIAFQLLAISRVHE